MIPCPNCGNNSLGKGGACGICGFRFEGNRTAQAKSARVQPASDNGWLNPVGIGLLLFGSIVTLYGLFSSGAPADSDTLNIGLLNDKTNLVLTGGFMFSAGLLCMALENVARRLAKTK